MYPQQPMAYPAPPAYPQQPQYAPPMPYALQGQPYYPPQQHAPAPPPAPAGSLDTFFAQPSNAGKSWVFKDRQIGTTYAGVVARPVTDADIRPQLDNANRPQTYRDGRQKYVMVVPMLMQATAEYPDGQAGWWVKGQARDELARAMAEAGAPAGPPEAGAFIQVQLIGKRPIPGMNDAFQYRVHYVRPQGSVPAQQPAPEPVRPAAGAYEQAGNPGAPGYPAQQQVQLYPMQQQATAQSAPVYPYPMPQTMTQPAPGVSVTAGQPMPQQFAVQPGPGISVTTAPPAPQQLPGMAMAAEVVASDVHQMPAGLDPEQQALFARLTGQRLVIQPPA